MVNLILQPVDNSTGSELSGIFSELCLILGSDVRVLFETKIAFVHYSATPLSVKHHRFNE